jgi:hypothetical protein
VTTDPLSLNVVAQEVTSSFTSISQEPEEELQAVSAALSLRDFLRARFSTRQAFSLGAKQAVSVADLEFSAPSLINQVR